MGKWSAESFSIFGKDSATKREGATPESALKLCVGQGVQTCNLRCADSLPRNNDALSAITNISVNESEGEHRQMSANAVHSDSRGRNLLGKIIDEIKTFLGMAVYLWVMFGLLALHASIVLAEHQMNYQFYGFAIVNSLILAKVMLVAEDLHLGERLRDRPLVYPILYKAFLFAILFIGFDWIEEVLVGLVRGKTVAQSIPDIGSGSQTGLLFVAIIVSVGLIPFFAFREIGRVIGERELRSLIFTDGARAAFQSRMRRGAANATQLGDRA